MFAYGQSGTGKCWAAGTQLMMHDGTSRAVEHIQAGDVLMGDDSGPRRVLPGSVISDVGAMFRVAHLADERNAWEVNGDHILVLRLERPPRITPAAAEGEGQGQGQNGGLVIVGHVLGAHDGLPTEVHSAVFQSAQRAQDALAQLLASWTPLVFECSVLQYLALDAALRADLAMFQPELVSFPAPARSLHRRLEGVLKREVSERELLEAAWALGVWLASHSHDDSPSYPSTLHAPRAAAATPAPLVVAERVQRWQASVADPAPRGEVEEKKQQCCEADSGHGLEAAIERTGSFFERLFPSSESGLKHKHFPAPLLQESVAVRRALLAGVLDSNGCATAEDGTGVDVRVPAPALDGQWETGLKHLARGLGFGVGFGAGKSAVAHAASSNSSGNDSTLAYVRIDTSGNDLHTLEPLLSLPLKLSPTPSFSASASASLSSSSAIAAAAAVAAVPSFSRHSVSFTITPVAPGRYHGFTLSGNGRLLLSNYLVTHNTFTMAGIKPNESNGFTTELLGLKPRMIERVYEMKNELRKTHDIDISCQMTTHAARACPQCALSAGTRLVPRPLAHTCLSAVFFFSAAASAAAAQATCSKSTSTSSKTCFGSCRHSRNTQERCVTAYTGRAALC